MALDDQTRQKLNSFTPEPEDSVALHGPGGGPCYGKVHSVRRSFDTDGRVMLAVRILVEDEEATIEFTGWRV